MTQSSSARIHPTALISPEAELAADVSIGAYTILEGAVRLGPGCVIRPHVHLIGPLSMGSNNRVYTGAVLGEEPQHLKYNGEPTRVEIGDNNIFREHVTVHRATTASVVTRIGSNNFFMANSHVAHDCVIGNHCILANGVLLGGHSQLEDSVYLSGNAAVHQFVRVGRLGLLSGVSGVTKDIPPFTMIQRHNEIMGVNVVGMRRAGIPGPRIDAVRKAFHILHRQGHTLPYALALISAEFGEVPEVMEMVAFIKRSSRGINLGYGPSRSSEAA